MFPLFKIVVSTFHFRLNSSGVVGIFTNPFEDGAKVKIAFEVKLPLLMHIEIFPTVMSQCAQPDVPVGSCNSEFIRIS